VPYCVRCRQQLRNASWVDLRCLRRAPSFGFTMFAVTIDMAITDDTQGFAQIPRRTIHVLA
jgi:hypothetical protein